MTGDCHVRFCESRGVRFPPATHQADDADFLWRDRLRVCPLKLRGDDHATELGEHIEDRGLGLLPIPRGERAGCLDVVGVMARRCIPADREGVHDEPERDRALHRFF